MRDGPPAATTHLSQIVTAGALKFPEKVIPRVVQILDPESISPQFRELFQAAVTDFEVNGNSEGGEVSAVLASAKSEINFRTFSDCQEMEIGSRDAIVAAQQLRRLLQRRVVEIAAQALLSMDGEKDFEGYASGLRDALDEYGAEPESNPNLFALADIYENPDLMKAPEPVVTRFAWRGRSTLFAAREKTGKSTLATAAAACVSSGSGFLDGPLVSGTVLYVGLEEHLADIARRFKGFDADQNRIYILDRVTRPLADLVSAVKEADPVLVVLDTLPAWVESLDLDPSSSSHWTPVMSGLTRVARQFDTALLILHHANRADGHYRDSSAIAASVDALIEMSPTKISNTRKFDVKARWLAEPFALQLQEEGGAMRYTYGQEEVSIDALVLDYVEQNSGCALREIRNGIGGKSEDVDRARTRLVQENMIENRGTGNRHKYYRVGAENDTEQKSIFESGVSHVSPQGHAIRHDTGHSD